MNCKDPFRPTPSPRLQREKGVALVVALILLVVMTLLGLGAMRSVTLEEKMAANTFDRSLSFQAAEASLREAESLLDTPTPPTCTRRQCHTSLARQYLCKRHQRLAASYPSGERLHIHHA
jgi:Tfp pilus assembly protein PilX